MWDTANELTQYKHKKSSPIFKLQKPDSNEFTENSNEINMLLVNEFVVDEVYDDENRVPVYDIEEYNKAYVYDEASIIKRDKGLTISTAEVNTAIGQLANKRCSGSLFIPLRVVKSLKNILAIQLSILFTFMCSQAHLL